MQKSILERAAPPTFDVCVEMVERHRWRIHSDVGASVDTILAGGVAPTLMRDRDEGSGAVRDIAFMGIVRRTAPESGEVCVRLCMCVRHRVRGHRAMHRP